MSTLRVTGLKQETSSATNISMAVGGGVTVAGIATFHNNAIFTNDVTVSGNISVGGTLTYQDVTDVDSIGIITARSGLNVTGGTVTVGGDPNDGSNPGCKMTTTGVIQAARASGSPTSATFMGFLEGDTSANFRVNANGSGYLMGDVGIGTDNPTATLEVATSVDGEATLATFRNTSGGGTNETVDIKLGLENTVASNVILRAGKEGNHSSGAGTDNFFAIHTTQNNTSAERLRINSAGNITINGSYIHGSLSAGGGGGGYVSKDEIAQYANSSSSNFFRGWDASGGSNVLRVQLKGNGGIANYQANDSNLCDEREKKNIVSLDSKWDKVKSWELKKFHYNEDADTDDLKYGVIAQQVEEHCPEVLTDWKKDEGVIRKGVKEQQMTWMAIKALQEAMTRIETLEAEVAALKES